MFNDETPAIILPEDAAFKETLNWLGTIGPRNGIGNQWNSAQERIDRARIMRNHFDILNPQDDEDDAE